MAPTQTSILTFKKNIECLKMYLRWCCHLAPLLGVADLPCFGVVLLCFSPSFVLCSFPHLPPSLPPSLPPPFDGGAFSSLLVSCFTSCFLCVVVFASLPLWVVLISSSLFLVVLWFTSSSLWVVPSSLTDGWCGVFSYLLPPPLLQKKRIAIYLYSLIFDC